MKERLIRILAASVLTATIAASSFAQITTTGSQPQMRDPFAGLKQSLGLTDAQVSQLQNLLQSQMSNLQPLFDDLASKQSALDNALKGTDATAIGNAMLALQGAQKTLKSSQDANHEALLAVLTPAQKQIVNTYSTVASNGGLGPLEEFGAGRIAFGSGAPAITIGVIGPRLTQGPF